MAAAAADAAALTGIHDWLPLIAPLADLLGVLALHAGPLLEARHDVIAGLEGIFCPLHGALIVPRLPRQKRGRGAAGTDWEGALGNSTPHHSVTGPQVAHIFASIQKSLSVPF